jgi:hypothetical protein
LLIEASVSVALTDVSIIDVQTSAASVVVQSTGSFELVDILVSSNNASAGGLVALAVQSATLNNVIMSGVFGTPAVEVQCGGPLLQALGIHVVDSPVPIGAEWLDSLC